MCRARPSPAQAALLFQVATLFFSGKASATDYLVDPANPNAYATVHEALDAVTGQDEFNRANIFIAPGRYNAVVTVDKPYVSLIGTGASPGATTLAFAQPISLGAAVEIRNTATAFMARNLTFENSVPDKNLGPAMALHSAAARALFHNVRFLGYQDTLKVDEKSRQYFLDCFITGDSDFIFGDATAVFDHCTIESTDYGWITAANTQRVTANGLVFLDCSLVPGADRNQSADDRTSARPQTVFLGRPWLWWEQPETMSSVIFIRTRMGTHIKPVGWDPWNETGFPTVNPNVNRDPLTRLSEFGSMDLNGKPLADSNGDGMPNGRVSWADPMRAEQAANYTLEHIFGPADFWNSTTQPETSGIAYESQGAPWNPAAQLAFLPIGFGPASQPLNISTRLGVQTGDKVLIAGFILTGTEPTTVLLRAMGPSLQDSNIANVLTDPELDLRDASGGRIAFDGDWKDAQESEIAATGIPPRNDREAAILATLAPGTYTAIVNGRESTAGVALVEVYRLSGTGGGELANISTRGFVGGGEQVMVAGFILAGGNGESSVMIRALGPSLVAAGIVEALADPMLELHDGNGILIASNDNWRDTQASEMEQSGLSPPDKNESAILATLPAGPYTAVLTGHDGGTGVGLLEVYQMGLDQSALRPSGGRLAKRSRE